MPSWAPIADQGAPPWPRSADNCGQVGFGGVCLRVCGGNPNHTGNCCLNRLAPGGHGLAEHPAVDDMPAGWWEDAERNARGAGQLADGALQHDGMPAADHPGTGPGPPRTTKRDTTYPGGVYFAVTVTSAGCGST